MAERSRPATATAAAADGILPVAIDSVSVAHGGTTVLESISMSIAPGSRNVVLGPNGAGKSTLLRVIHGLIPPTGGTVRWRIDDRERIRRSQAMVFQRPVMLRRTAQQNVEFALRVARSRVTSPAPGADPDAAAQSTGRGFSAPGDVNNERIGSERIRADAHAALERVGLAALHDRPARLCSIGEQQRIALARAWALEPELLFLDEPTASLDPAATRAVESVIAAMHASGTTIVMTTHDLGQARRVADRVLFLHRGRLLEDSSADVFFSHPASREAAAFVNGELLW